MPWLREKFLNLSIVLGLLLILTAFLLLGFGINFFGLSSDALLSLISAIIGGLIATSSQTWISSQDRQNQLRLANIEKRLEVHQQAWALWKQLVLKSDSQKEVGAFIFKEFQPWWDNNCLYLSANVRTSLYKAYLVAPSIQILRQGKLTKELEEAWETLNQPGKEIELSVELPTISDIENPYPKKNKS